MEEAGAAQVARSLACFADEVELRTGEVWVSQKVALRRYSTLRLFQIKSKITSRTTSVMEESQPFEHTFKVR